MQYDIQCIITQDDDDIYHIILRDNTYHIETESETDVLSENALKVEFQQYAKLLWNNVISKENINKEEN